MSKIWKVVLTPETGECSLNESEYLVTVPLSVLQPFLSALAGAVVAQMFPTLTVPLRPSAAPENRSRTKRVDKNEEPEVEWPEDEDEVRTPTGGLDFEDEIFPMVETLIYEDLGEPTWDVLYIPDNGEGEEAIAVTVRDDGPPRGANLTKSQWQEDGGIGPFAEHLRSLATRRPEPQEF